MAEYFSQSDRTALVKIGRWVLLVIALAFSGCMAVLNLPASPFTQPLRPFQKAMLDPLNLYAGGWKMFTSGAPSIQLSRTALHYSDRTEYVEPVTARTTWKWSTWHKVRENLQGFTPSFEGQIQRYLEYQCRTRPGLQAARIETTLVEVPAIRNNPYFNEDSLQYFSRYVWNCY